MPRNYGDFNNDFTWLVYIIESPDRNIEAWHDSITLKILPDRNIGVQYIRYTSEYISKLQIHQHSLLTKKVFFRHNFQHWSFSLYQLDHLIICISSLLSFQVIFILWIWIISRSGSSSLDLDHHGTSSLDLDHLSIWINIIGSGSSINLDHHHWI